MSKKRALALVNEAQKFLDEAQKFLDDPNDQLKVQKAKRLNDWAEALLKEAEVEENKGDD